MQQKVQHGYRGKAATASSIAGGLGCLAFSPDSRTLVWGAPSGQLLLFETATCQIRQRLTGHHGRINALVFWPEGTLLASASHDSTTLIWDLLGTVPGSSARTSSQRFPRAPVQAAYER
jgi:WD40 repeat protein